MTDVIIFPLHRVRLPESDETWCQATEEAIRGKGLSRAELALLLERIALFRKLYPQAQPSSAPWSEFLTFEPEGAA